MRRVGLRQNNDGKTALDWADKSGKKDEIKNLIASFCPGYVAPGLFSKKYCTRCGAHKDRHR